MLYLGIFGLEFGKAIVIEISTLKLLYLQIFNQKNFGTKNV